MITLLCGALALAGSYEDGVAALKAGNAAEALVHLKAAAKEQPESADVHWELGWAHWELGEYRESLAAWDVVQKVDPKHEELQHWRTAAEAKIALMPLKQDAAPPPEETASEGRIRFAAVGDLMMGSDLKDPGRLPPGDGSSIFVDTSDALRAADLAFANLEGPLADGLPSSKCKPDSTNCYAFRTPTRLGKALVGAGIDLASLANNHAMDLGAAGQESTMKLLDGLGIAHSGRYGDVGWAEVQGLKVALVAAHTGTCCLNINDVAEIAAAVRLADEKADLVVFSFHGGAEGASAGHVPGKLEIGFGEKRGDVKAAAHAAIDAGADLVLGHGPHVIRAMEVYRGRLIAYSLGNFCGYRQFSTKGATGITVLLEAELAKNGVLTGARVIPLRMDENGVPMKDPTGEAAKLLHQLSQEDFPHSGVRVADDGTLSWGG